MQSSSFDFDVITGPSVPEDRKPDATPPSPTQAPPAATPPATRRTR
jgi:hypothetical protein